LERPDSSGKRWRASHPSTCPRFESTEKSDHHRGHRGTQRKALSCDRLSRESQSLNWSGRIRREKDGERPTRPLARVSSQPKSDHHRGHRGAQRKVLSCAAIALSRKAELELERLVSRIRICVWLGDSSAPSRAGFFGLTFIGYLVRRAIDESHLPSSKQPKCFDSAWVAGDVWNQGQRSSTGRGWFAEVEVPILEPVLHRWQRCSSSAPPKKTNPIEWSSVQDYEPFRVTMCDVTHREFASD